MKYEKIQELYEKWLKMNVYRHILDFPDNYTTDQVERAKYKLWKEFDSIKEELLNSMQETWEAGLIPEEKIKGDFIGFAIKKPISQSIFKHINGIDYVNGTEENDIYEIKKEYFDKYYDFDTFKYDVSD